MASNKNKKKVEVVVEEKIECPVVESARPEIEPVKTAPHGISAHLNEAKTLIAELDKSHREINLAAQDATVALNRALSLVLFIENTQAEIAKKKR